MAQRERPRFQDRARQVSPVVERVSPTNAPRASGSQSGERSPARYGRKTRPSAPGATRAALRTRPAAPPRPPTTLSASQSSDLPVALIAPPTSHLPGSGASATQASGTAGRESQ